MTSRKDKLLIDKIRATDSSLDKLIMKLSNTSDTYQFLESNYNDREITSYKKNDILDFLENELYEKNGIGRVIINKLSERSRMRYLDEIDLDNDE